jgi:class I lanthipeptide synthase
MGMRWEPVLDGDLAEAALGAARGIAIELAAQPAGTARDRALFWAYAAAVFDEPFANAAYSAAVDDLVAELRRGVPHVALYGGLAGLGWTLCHVVDDVEDALRIIDEALVAMLAIDPWPGAHDLTRGLVGLGVYFLERITRGDRGLAGEGLARVVEHLARAAVSTDQGTTWLSAPALLPPELALEWPDGYYDCGVAHGVPGIIALLANAAPYHDRARALAIDAIRWLVAQRLAPSSAGRFPTRIALTGATRRARAAWCYGDPGIAAVLWTCASRLDTAHDLATETALDSTRRELATAGVRDAGLCHGAAGLAHLFGRLHHASGDRVFAGAARAWFVRALVMPRPRDPSFLEGTMGLGLALLAGATATEPRWDRLLLCDVTGGGR